ncbi:hypothetical protein H4Q26_000479 [Puccinia striiformis f. sp. tritici PST-130]|nr:hypothetical protein H4Q26_000479 [Puccinia striiformis f. sp. tritici PST-130]
MDTSIRESPLEARFEYKVKISPVQDDRPPDHSALNPSDRSHRSNQRRLLVGLCFETVNANWDEATAKRCSKDIQIAECAHNTRLSYPDVQLMALFTVNHADDRYHGCPYGTCCAFTQLPLVNDMEPNPGNSHCFFRYDLAGFPGMGTNPIADPQTGTYGYETSIDGTFHRGPVDKRTRQPNHDRNYPGFHLPKAWPKRLPFPKQPNIQPHVPQRARPIWTPDKKEKDGKEVDMAAGIKDTRTEAEAPVDMPPRRQALGAREHRG